MRDAGIVGSAQKIASLLRPFLWTPAYVLSNGAAPLPDDSSDRFAELGRQLRERIKVHGDRDADYVARASVRAQRALSGRWTVLGFGDADIPRGAGWARDSFHDFSWPSRYFPFVDYLAAHSRCDVKVVWELSRLQYLMWLAEGIAVVPPLRDQCAARFATIVEDWITHNPPGIGVNWACAMEVAIRGVNLMLAGAIAMPELGAGTRARVLQSLAQHYWFLRRFPEISDVPGNHYLANLLGLVGLSAIVGAGTFEYHLSAFAAEAERQFEPDGCHIERAPMYHRLCTDMLALAAAFDVRQRRRISAQIAEILSRAIGFARAVADPHGILPIFGDCDSGQILEFGLQARNIDALSALTEAWGSRPLPDQTIWLNALAGRRSAMRLPVAARQSWERRGGFLVAKSASFGLAMRVGSQGLAGRASHDHDDAQSIWLSAAGRDLLVDQGCHSYTLDPKIRYMNLSSRAHNVLQRIAAPRYEGRLGSINLTMRGAPTCRAATVSCHDDIVTFVAQIEQVGPVANAKRRVELEPTGGMYELRVFDSWQCDDQVELRWHFGPGLRPALRAGACVEFTGNAPIRVVRFESSDPIEVELFDFDFSPVYGQTCPCFGVRVVSKPGDASDVHCLLSRFEISTEP